ncbi:hypothetical protein [Pseudonocardia broussonetiae]|uniref:Uncharacterized protein n=1 Tax=Pseudonocardia broussonetiae TaxID=2736640 RepID=A0A6M6JL61_9PSEU|nr:hypothetical protein [Pseudonocardia broussonetiae]QJY47362.1 hypothetical protein HOP40_17385 [Pseudonocardia broussonetiae]
MTDPSSDPALEAEIRGIARTMERRTDPGATAVTVAVAVLVVLGSLALPWTGAVLGWQVLAGLAPDLGVLPRLFTFTSVGFGVLGSALALSTRWWALAWVCAVGSGISVVTGIWAVWSRQTVVPDGGTGPHVGMVLAVLAMVVLAASWSRIALRR